MIVDAFKDSRPAAFGYVPLGMAFGILFQSLQLNWIYGFLMSFLVYAGSAQFIAIPLLANHGSLLSLAIATFLVNLRHIFYGLSFLDKFKFNNFIKYYLIFGLTDESYSIICSKNTYADPKYEIYVVFMCHFYWVLGTFFGILLYSQLMDINIQFLFFTLVALFAILTVDSFKVNKDFFSLIVGIVSYAFFKIIGVKEYLFFSMLLSFIAIFLKVFINEKMEKKMSLNNNSLYILAAIVIMSLVTYSTRVIPFIFFQKLNSYYLKQTGKCLPVCLMAILTLYSIDCLKEFDQNYFENGWIACILTVAFYLFARSVLGSMIFGTIMYYLLLNSVINFINF